MRSIKAWFLGLVLTTGWVMALMADQTSVDLTFNPGSGANGLVESVLQQPDGKILIMGNFSTFNGQTAINITRLLPTGAIDPTFHANVNDWVRTAALQKDGKIVIGGYFKSIDGQSRNLIARLNSNGSLDTSFNPGTGLESSIAAGIDGNTNAFTFVVAVQADGKILIGGNFQTYNGQRSQGIARANADGTLDTSFLVGSGVDSWVRSITVLANSQIVLSGWFQQYNNQGFNRMVRLSAAGVADASFHPNFGDSTSVYTVAVLPDGRYIVGGHAASGGPFTNEMARLNADGSFDPAFVGRTDDKVESIKLQSDGKIVIGGYFSYVDGVIQRNLARLNADGTLDTSFVPSVDSFVWTIALQTDKKILASGGFTTVDTLSRRGVARLLPGTTVTLPPPSSLLHVTVVGPGTVTPNLTTSPLQIGKVYSIKAVPTGDAIFTGWNDGGAQTNALLQFAMSQNLNLTAHFVPNPFRAPSGTYYGLIDPTDGTAGGSIVLALAPSGVYSVRVTTEHGGYVGTGRFGSDLKVQTTLNNASKIPLTVSLQVSGTPFVLRGTIQEGDVTSDVVGNPQIAGAVLNPIDVGKYTLLVGAANSGTGVGVGVATVAANGASVFVMILPDGTVARVATPVAANGQIPIFTSLYGGQGALSGWLSISYDGDTISGALKWSHTGFFTNNMPVDGDHFTATAPSVNILPGTNFVVMLQGGGLPQTILEPATIVGGRITVAAPNTNRIAVVYYPANGYIVGQYLDPVTHKPAAFNAVLLQDGSLIRGGFSRAGQYGTVYIGVHP